MTDLSKKPVCLEIKLNGETSDQLWNNLVDLVCYAVECKQAQENRWPHMVSTEAGKITVIEPDL